MAAESPVVALSPLDVRVVVVVVADSAPVSGAESAPGTSTLFSITCFSTTTCLVEPAVANEYRLKPNANSTAVVSHHWRLEPRRRVHPRVAYTVGVGLGSPPA